MNHLLFVIQVELAEDLFGSKIFDRHKHHNRDVIWPNSRWQPTRNGDVPSGKQTVCYWKWPFIVDFPIKHGDSP